MSLLTDSEEEAITKVEELKTSYGYGVSSKLIVFNGTSDTLVSSDSEHFSGRWENEPPAEVS